MLGGSSRTCCASARSGDLPGAKKDLAEIDGIRKDYQAKKKTYGAEWTDMLYQEASAWLLHGEGKNEEATAARLNVADHEDAIGPEQTSTPAREMLADMLLEMKRPEQALEEYKGDLRFNPKRFNGLDGAAQAAEMAGQASQATEYYAVLVKTCDGGSSGVQNWQRRSRQWWRRSRGLSDPKARTLFLDALKPEQESPPSELDAHLDRRVAGVFGIPYPDFAFGLQGAGGGFGRDQDGRKRSSRNANLLPSRFSTVARTIVVLPSLIGKSYFSPSCSGKRLQVVEAGDHVGGASGEIVVHVFGLPRLQILFIQRAFLAPVIEVDRRFAFVGAFLAVLESKQARARSTGS